MFDSWSLVQVVCPLKCMCLTFASLWAIIKFEAALEVCYGNIFINKLQSVVTLVFGAISVWEVYNAGGIQVDMYCAICGPRAAGWPLP